MSLPGELMRMGDIVQATFGITSQVPAVALAGTPAEKSAEAALPPAKALQPSLRHHHLAVSNFHDRIRRINQLDRRSVIGRSLAIIPQTIA